MPKVIIHCRETQSGAYTSTEEGEVIKLSGSGRHWSEVIEAPVGYEFVIKDISNSGKHNCVKARITGEDEYKIVEKADDPCQFCYPAED